jgi:dipeptidyl aminopeptidase/acylaminoacyl peptidase
MSRLYFFILAIIVFSTNTLFSQDTKKVMSIIDFLNIPGVSNPALSPDGSDLVYVLSESDWESNRQVPHLWRVNLNGEDPRQITYGEKGERSPAWSPDGKHISFLAQRGDSEGNQLFVMRADGGEGRQLSDHPTSLSSYAWAPDGQYIYFLASDTLSAEKEAALKKNDDVYAYDENYTQRHLWRINVESGAEERLTEGDFTIADYDLSEDGQTLVVHRAPNPLYDNYSDSEVWIMKVDGSEAVQLTDNKVGESSAILSPDGSQVAFVAFANEDFDFYYNDKLFLMNADGSGQAVVPMKAFSGEVNGAEWSADGQSIFFTANIGTAVQLFEYDLASQKWNQITEGEFSLGNWRYYPKLDKHLMSVAHAKSPGELFHWENGAPKQITHHYDYLYDTFQLPTQQVISWKGVDGVTVEGVLYLPYNYQEGTRLPLVVQTHGGPASSDKYGMSRSFTRYNAVLTGKGYAVLQPNYRGSTGYGDDFLRDMVGGYFRQSHLDVMAGVDHLIEEGIADADRLVKMGWSAGGHMTNKIVTFTDRFKAASSGAGAVNWMGMYAQSDVRTYRTPWFGGTPWQKDAPIDVYWDNSPLKDIHKVTTPTLVVVGESDPRVPLPQSVEMYRAMRSNGVPTHLYVAPREPHGWQELRHRLFKINVELEWFAKYALEKEYEWEKEK